MLGPILLGRLFDTIGRKVMIATTYAMSGILPGGDRLSLQREPPVGADPHHRLDARLLLCLRGGELRLSDCERDFPAGDSALAIAFFYAIGTGVGGVAGPLLLGVLINTGSRGSVAIGYLIGALLMIAAAAVEAVGGVAAEGKPLETVARPLSFVES